MKNKILLLIILALAFYFGLVSGNPYKEEVVDLGNFTEYYEEGTDETGGWEVQKDNFYTFSKDYSIGEAQEEQKDVTSKDEKPEKKEYIVVEGDTLSKIANKFGITLEILNFANPGISAKTLKIGQKLNVYTQNGIFYKIAKGDTLNSIAELFKVQVEDLKKENNLTSDIVQVGTEIFIKNPNLKTYLAKINPPIKKKNISNAKSNEFGFIMPIKYTGINSPFGNRFHPVLNRYIFHTGVDLKAKFIPLYAAKAGKVIFAGVMNGYGKIIIIQHSGGFETRYAHLDKIGVKKGDNVNQGELIGKTGQSGRVTGPHLHFEIRIYGKVVNPMKYIPAK